MFLYFIKYYYFFILIGAAILDSMMTRPKVFFFLRKLWFGREIFANKFLKKYYFK